MEFPLSTDVLQVINSRTDGQPDRGTFSVVLFHERVHLFRGVRLCVVTVLLYQQSCCRVNISVASHTAILQHFVCPGRGIFRLGLTWSSQNGLKLTVCASAALTAASASCDSCSVA